MSLRVTTIVPTLLCGGTENQAITLASALDRKEYSVDVACLRRWGLFVNHLADRGIPLREYPIPSFASVTSLVQQTRFAARLAKQRTDVVHAYSFYGNVFAVVPARLAGVPVVIASVRDRGAYLTPMQKRVQRLVCRFADCVLVNAQAVKDWLVSEGYDAERIEVIRNGVDLQRFDQRLTRAELGGDLGLPPGTRTVAVVSRLARQKGLEQFIDAAEELSVRYPDVRFIVVGQANADEAEFENILKARADQAGLTGRVVFAGLRSDVPALMSAIDVSVMPSLNEALSNVLLESMAAGAPIVATRVGGTPEAIQDGVSGLLVEPGDPHALAAAIARLLDDPLLASRLGSAAKNVIKDQFSIVRMIEDTERLYRRLLDRKQRKPFWHVLRPADH
jgi:glycosyltransferase involved in cell wall biosynthesis